jgi:PilZ domain
MWLKVAAASVDHRSVRGDRTVVPIVNEPATSLRRLKQQQRVEIHIDSDDQVVACRVAAVQGSVATLTRITELGAEELEKFTPGVLAYMLFEHRGAMTALKGIATASAAEESELAFVVIDGVQLPERRADERVSLSAVARLSDPRAGGAGAIETPTANVSAGGILIGRPAALGDGPSFRLELVVEHDPEPIRCGATIVRATSSHVALKFIEIQDADRIRLAGMIRGRTLAVGS